MAVRERGEVPGSLQCGAVRQPHVRDGVALEVEMGQVLLWQNGNTTLYQRGSEWRHEPVVERLGT